MAMDAKKVEEERKEFWRNHNATEEESMDWENSLHKDFMHEEKKKNKHN